MQDLNLGLKLPYCSRRAGVLNFLGTRTPPQLNDRAPATLFIAAVIGVEHFLSWLLQLMPSGDRCRADFWKG